MTTIVGIAGSLRRHSLNAKLLAAVADLLPDEAMLDFASIEGIPLYNQDIEDAQGIPSAVAALKDRIAAADAMLLATPEYNNGVPGVLKNAIDWLSRPPSDIGRVFGGKPVAIMGATPGPLGTRMSQTAWLPVLRALGAELWTARSLYVPRAGDVFDAGGEWSEDDLRDRAERFIGEFVDFVQRRR